MPYAAEKKMGKNIPNACLPVENLLYLKIHPKMAPMK